jgi:hypothetical protein
MIWLIVSGSLILYFIPGVLYGIKIARDTYEADRKRYPSLAESNPREGLPEAAFMFGLTIFLWWAVMLVNAIRHSGTWFLTRVVMPNIRESERQKEAEKRKQHVRELERELLDTHGASGVGNVRQRTLGVDFPRGESMTAQGKRRKRGEDLPRAEAQLEEWRRQEPEIPYGKIEKGY